jgi:ABC-2 type transport system permease protein
LTFAEAAKQKKSYGERAAVIDVSLEVAAGEVVPSFIFPPWLQTVSMWMPTHWAGDGLDAMTWRGLQLQDALLPVAAFLGFTLLFSAVALARLQWQEQGVGAEFLSGCY